MERTVFALIPFEFGSQRHVASFQLYTWVAAHSLPLVNNISDVNFAEVHHLFVAIYKIHGISISGVLGNQGKEKKMLNY